MASEKRLIDKEALIKSIQEPSIYDINKPDFISLVNEQPTIDAVEVVRCKDCKYFYCCSAVDRMFYCQHHCGLKHIQAVEEDSYCSYGERRKNGA